MNPLIKDHLFPYFDCFLVEKDSHMYGKKNVQCFWGMELQESLQKIQCAKSIFLHPNAFSNWSEFLLQCAEFGELPVKLVCISHSDISLNTVDILPLRQAFPNTIFWIQNWCGDISGCELFPIGINSFGMKTIQSPIKTKSFSITYVTPNSYDRMEFHNFLYSNPELAPYCLPFLEREDYFIHISEALFLACPCGNGYDTYRFWECLHYKTIPIVKNNIFFKTLKQQYPELPFLLLDSWDQLAPLLPKLTIDYYETLWSTANISVGTDQYWLTKLCKILDRSV